MLQSPNPLVYETQIALNVSNLCKNGLLKKQFITVACIYKSNMKLMIWETLKENIDYSHKRLNFAL